MNCLVTGASGFLGGHLCRRLEQLGHSVYKLKHDEIGVLEIPEVDYVFNLMAYGNHHYQDKLYPAIQSNITELCILMDLVKAQEKPYKAFINVGSSSEYGVKLEAMREDTVLEPDTFYAATKAAGTYLARAYAKKYDKPIITVRPFSIYGSGEAPHRFIPTVIQKIKSGELLDLVEGLHDWIHVSDVVEAMIKLLPYAKDYKGEVFNIGTGEEYSNEYIVEALEQLLGKNARINMVESMRPNDSIHWYADTTKLKSVLGWHWKPKHIITGLKEVVNDQ